MNVRDGMKDTMDNRWMPLTSFSSGIGLEVTSDVYCFTNQIVNVVFVGNPKKPRDWVLIDAGMPESTNAILSAVEHRFGENSQPKAIILTHGHFDHVGAVIDLVRKWQVPVYAHKKELPYVTGQSSYPEPDGAVEGGLVAKISPIFPYEPIDLGENVKALPADGSVPELPEWRWLHTPGHTPGHVSLFREKDRMLIAGDAFVTVKQDSLYKVITQDKEINGPPRYFTPDWESAKMSVQKLQKLQPIMAVTGHGEPVSGKELREGLEKLANHFDELAVPDDGRYVQPTH